VHGLTEDESDDIKDKFHEDLESVMDQFPTYHTNIFKSKVKLSLCLTKHYAMKAYLRSVGIAPCIL
jgi:hypothetical protein